MLRSAAEPAAAVEPDRSEAPGPDPREPERPAAARAPEPRIEPWSPDSDPWRFDPEPAAVPDAAPEPAPEPEPRVEPDVEAWSEPEVRAEPDPEPAAAPARRWSAPPEEPPDWLAEPTEDAGAISPPPSSPPDGAAPAVEPEVVAESDASPFDAFLGAEPAEPAQPAAPAPEADVAPEAEAPEVEPKPSWRSALPWFSSNRADDEPEDGADVALAEPEPEPEPAPEPAPAPSLIPIAGGFTVEAPPSPGAEVEARAEPEAATPEPESEPEPLPEPPIIPIASGLAVEEPESGDPWAEPAWPERGDSTQVLPTSWTPPAREPEAIGELTPTAGPIRTSFADADVDDAEADELAAPTMAEQAVPWLIGVILLLAGMVIVLLALIFAGDGSLGGTAPTPSPTLAVAVPLEQPSGTAAPTEPPSQAPIPSDEPTPTPAPGPQYGPLEMVYQGRSAALAPIYLLHRDFAAEQDPEVMAQDGTHDVARFAWAPNGRAGAGLLADILVSIEPGTEKRPLGDGLTTLTFGDDTSTVYAVRVTPDGGNDVATVLAIDFESGEAEELGSVTYVRPAIEAEPPLAEAQFSDEGGTVRLIWMEDDTLRLWALGAGAWTIDPAAGSVDELDGEALPTLWSPDGTRRITVERDADVSTVELRNAEDRVLARTTAEGRVSHVRWSPRGDRVAFTVGHSAPGGGILQDLFLWDLADGAAPMQLTNTGAAFGAEWLGSQPLWRD